MRFVLIIRWMITKVNKPAWSAGGVLKKPDLKICKQPYYLSNQE
jgi:hypothetical protein